MYQSNLSTGNQTRFLSRSTFGWDATQHGSPPTSHSANELPSSAWTKRVRMRFIVRYKVARFVKLNDWHAESDRDHRA